MSAEGHAVFDGKAAMEAIASVGADPRRIQIALAQIGISASINAEGKLILGGQTSIDAAVSLALNAAAVMDAAAEFNIVTALAALSIQVTDGVVSIHLTPSLLAHSSGVAIATAVIGIASDMAASANMVLSGEISIAAVSSVELSAILYILYELGYTGTLGAGDVLVIDTDAQTITLNAVNATRYFTGDFWHLRVGTNDVIWKDDDAGRTAELKLEHEPRWL